MSRKCSRFGRILDFFGGIKLILGKSHIIHHEGEKLISRKFKKNMMLWYISPIFKTFLIFLILNP